MVWRGGERDSREEAHHAVLLRCADARNESRMTFQASPLPTEHADDPWILGRKGWGSGWAQGPTHPSWETSHPLNVHLLLQCHTCWLCRLDQRFLITWALVSSPKAWVWGYEKGKPPSCMKKLRHKVTEDIFWVPHGQSLIVQKLVRE